MIEKKYKVRNGAGNFVLETTNEHIADHYLRYGYTVEIWKKRGQNWVKWMERKTEKI